MSFATTDFFFFLLATFFIYNLARKHKPLKEIALLNISIIFYSFFDLKFLTLLAASVFLNYQAVHLIKNLRKQKAKKTTLVVAIIANILFLGFYKYFNFFIDSILDLSFKYDLNINIQVARILAPVGISFFTFRAISHLVESYKGLKQPTFISFANYLTFFPHILAGPIARPKDFYQDLEKNNRLNQGRIILLIFSGLFKKLVISSYLYSFIQEPFSSPENFSSPELFVSSVIFGLYLYTDFSGYSDLAIAVSNLFGFKTKKNFNQPFKATSASEFWNRWHITLSTWLRDYIYIPLGGDGRNKPKWKSFFKYRNLILTLTISGIWHGAGWGFLLWGLAHGILLVIENLWKKVVPSNKNNSTIGYLKTIFAWLWTFVTINLLWIFFNTDNFETTKSYIKNLFSFDFSKFEILDLRLSIVLLTIIIFNLIPLNYKKIAEKISLLNYPLKLVLIITLGYLTIKLGPDLIPPFVYASF